MIFLQNTTRLFAHSLYSNFWESLGSRESTAEYSDESEEVSTNKYEAVQQALQENKSNERNDLSEQTDPDMLLEEWYKRIEFDFDDDGVVDKTLVVPDGTHPRWRDGSDPDDWSWDSNLPGGWDDVGPAGEGLGGEF